MLMKGMEVMSLNDYSLPALFKQNSLMASHNYFKDHCREEQGTL